MPRRKTSTDRQAPRPLLQIERIVYEKASFKLSRRMLTNLAEYAVYLRHVTGEEPAQDEIIEKGMQRLFDADRGFRQWLQRNRSEKGHGIETGLDA